MAMKKYSYTIFFLILISLKISAIHVYVYHNHDEHIDDCEICQNVIYSQNIEFSPLQQFHSLEEIYHISTFSLCKSHYESVFKKSSNSNKTHFGRPPPFLLM